MTCRAHTTLTIMFIAFLALSVLGFFIVKPAPCAAAETPCPDGRLCPAHWACCEQGCCAPSSPPARRDDDPLREPGYSYPWYAQWSVLFLLGTLGGILVCCVWCLFVKRSHGVYMCSLACCVRRPASDHDSAGSVYPPPHYSRCGSFHQAPPPYSEVTSKPDLYPLVITCGDGEGKAGGNYLMVHYFRNYVIRAPGSLSATSTAESLNSSFICNAANEANSIIPPPYSCASNYSDCGLGCGRSLLRSLSSLTDARPAPPAPPAPSPAPHVHSSTDPDPRPGKAAGEVTGSGGAGDPNEDWCAVCMDGGELMCCDKCPKVFHQYCHIPTIEKLPDETETWQCLLCVNFAEEWAGAGAEAWAGEGLSPRQQRLVERLTLELYCQYEPSLPFREPVPKDNLHYHSKIVRPMCLDTIRMKLQPRSVQRYTHVAQFVADCRLLFRNAYHYNPPDSAIFKDAKRLEEFFDAQLLKWLPEYAYWAGDGDPPPKRARADPALC